MSATLRVQLDLTASQLEPLGAGFLYEGWVIADGAPVSTGTFQVSPGQQSLSQTVSVANAATVSRFVLSIEPVPDPDPAPSATKPFAGDVTCSGLMCTASATATAGTGVDLATSSGQFFLAAPTGSGQGATFENGIWFFTRPSTPMNIPSAPSGWRWEGWVVRNGMPISTGTFVSPSGSDSDGAGPNAGTMPGASAAPPFPGQDYVLPPRNLTDGYSVVISLEPNPDDSTAPFTFKPLSKSIANTNMEQDFVVTPFSNRIGVTLSAQGAMLLPLMSWLFAILCFSLL
eukprot:TRINITY_DN6694_c0_g1_i2.p1 TRINITY_DN6694_c0_g1~~TRINITY_DN6694_c0_g1_i2.p1  ORF type:complete len:299 (-),score=22.01 TRINITY_DN6694_c0_g1_i2:193-1053(-)